MFKGIKKTEILVVQQGFWKDPIGNLMGFQNDILFLNIRIQRKLLKGYGSLPMNFCRGKDQDQIGNLLFTYFQMEVEVSRARQLEYQKPKPLW